MTLAYMNEAVRKMLHGKRFKTATLLISFFLFLNLIVVLPVSAQSVLYEEGFAGHDGHDGCRSLGYLDEWDYPDYPGEWDDPDYPDYPGEWDYPDYPEDWINLEDYYYSDKGTKYIITRDFSEQTAEQLVQYIMGDGVQILDVRYTGTDVSAGSFTAEDASIIGFNEGIILSTGNIRYVDGPNCDPGISHVNKLDGDKYLDLLIPGYTTYDATIVEFDFIPSQNTLSFDYVFSSEEYNEFVGSLFNDVFGFFLNGKNIALIPNTDIPVAINNINKEQFAQYFRDNSVDGEIMTEMDGLTTVLTVTAAVNVGVKNTIRMAIADAGDQIFDSNVLIKGSSFTSTESDVLQFAKHSREVMENDGIAEIVVSRSGNMDETVTVDYYTSDGSAKAPVDYLETAGTLVFEPGIASKVIPVTIVDDDIVGDTKTFRLHLENVKGNAIIGNYITARIYIIDDDIASSQTQTVLWEEKTEVPVNKNYIIHFSAEINPETVTPENFYVQDENGEIMAQIKPEITFNNLAVIMKTSEFTSYEHGKTYTLYINPNVENLKGTKLGKQIKMYFTTQDLQ